MGQAVALDLVIAAVAEVLAGLNLADQVLTDPPAHLPDDRVFVVYADPGDATLAANSGRNGRAVYQADDAVRVDFHRRAARDAMAEAYPEALSIFTTVRDAVFGAVKHGALGGTIVGFSGIRTDTWGPMEFWDSDTTFGFQIAVLVRHMTESAS